MWTRVGVVSVVIAGAACGSNSGDSVTYVATDLGPIDAVGQGYSDLASAYMNDRGEIAAIVRDQPSIYRTNQWQAVGPVGLVPAGSRIVGFSGQREIVVTSGNRTYFIDTAATATEIVPPAAPGNAPNATAGAMSPDGTVAGWFFKGVNPPLPELFTWKAGVFTDRGPGIEVYGINDAGAIVASTNTTANLTDSALVLADGTRFTLSSSIAPSACNASGVAGGEEGVHPQYPVLFDHGVVVELVGPHVNETVSADIGTVTALNDAGDAVGVIDEHDQHPFVILHAGKLASLASLFPVPGAAMPVAIDNQGDILVTYADPSRAGTELFLLKVKTNEPPAGKDTAVITLTGAPAGIDASPFGTVTTMATLSATHKRLDLGVTAGSTIAMGARTIQLSVVLPLGGAATITEGATYNLAGLAGTNTNGGSLTYYQRIINDKGGNDVLDTFGAAGGSLTIDKLGAVTHLTLTGVQLSGAKGVMQLDGTINTVNLVAP